MVSSTCTLWAQFELGEACEQRSREAGRTTTSNEGSVLQSRSINTFYGLGLSDSHAMAILLILSIQPTFKIIKYSHLSTLYTPFTPYYWYNLRISSNRSTCYLTPPDYLREELLERFGGNEYNVMAIPAYLDTLLKRLGVNGWGPCITGMSIYLTHFCFFFGWELSDTDSFGHEVLTTCSYCQSFNDFALYALPTLLLEYILEIGFVRVRLFHFVSAVSRFNLSTRPVRFSINNPTDLIIFLTFSSFRTMEPSWASSAHHCEAREWREGVVVVVCWF